MAAAEYPLPSVSGSNPKPSVFYKLEPDEYQVTESVYDDGGRDFALQAGGTPIRTWIIDYAAITLAEAAILDAHVNSAGYSPEHGSSISFNFRDRDTTTLYSGCRYAAGGYERKSHRNRQVQSRSVKIVKYP